eukprot:CAMPEP_0178976256 /NCGR_PEP_ID=MMETSP0789-20121207/23715_1 /TAXON_ID=3005 /ORGANISM="Rhizosolenia setigera, Strain CCMP 1694" /LENGTH=386 /DNA_ID=CAMNT_0020665289 /DNA_START=94 /DNA_END=1254 /DNA_ORIENTATION=+
MVFKDKSIKDEHEKRAKDALQPESTSKRSKLTLPVTSSVSTTNDTFDTLPDEVVLDKIIPFIGKEYLGIGAVNKRLNNLFKSSDIPNETSYGGYASFEALVSEFEENYNRYTMEFYHREKIVGHIVTGIICYNRDDLVTYVEKKQDKYLSHVICCEAANRGDITVLRKMFDIVDEDSLQYIRQRRHLCYNAAFEGKIECLKFLRDHTDPDEWNGSDLCGPAAHGGKLECLKYLHELGCEMNEDTCELAAGGGSLECLQYMHKHGCPWIAMGSYYAAREGHLDCLKFLHETGCPLTDETCIGAAEDGRLECLQYLHEHGCPWTDEACSACVGSNNGGHLECLRYLHENGCPWTIEACEDAAAARNYDCLRYMRDNGLEWDHYARYID